MVDTNSQNLHDGAPLQRTIGGGLVNPLVKNPEISEPAPGSLPARPEPKVNEPRWQVVVSLVIVAFILFLEFVLPRIIRSFNGN